MISFSAYVTEKRRLPNGIVIQNDDLVTPLRKPTFSRGQIRSQADIYRHWKKLKDTKGKTCTHDKSKKDAKDCPAPKKAEDKKPAK